MRWSRSRTYGLLDRTMRWSRSRTYGLLDRTMRWSRWRRQASVVELEAGAGPGNAHEAPARRERRVGRAEVVAAEADVRDHGVAEQDLVEHLARGRDHRERAGHQRRDDDVAVAVDAERVEQLHSGKAADHRAGRARFVLLHFAGRGDIPRVHAAGVGLGRVQPRAVGRETDAVR